MSQYTRFLPTAALLLAASLRAQTWTGGGLDTNVDTVGNWTSLPAFDGSETITIGTGGSAINLNQSIAVDGITFNRDLGAVFSVTRPGTQTLTLGSGGVTVNSGLTAATQFYLNSPLTLAGSSSFTSNFGTGTDANTAGLRLIGIDAPSNSTLTFGGSGHTWQFGSVTGSNLTLTKNDAGTLTFRGGTGNNLTAVTTFNINQGTVRMSGNDANSSSGSFPVLNSSSVMNLADGATVNFATSSATPRTLYNLNGQGNVNHTNNGTRSVALNVGTGNTATFGGHFGGSGGLQVIKTGAGTQIFNRTSTMNTSVKSHTVLGGTLLYAYRDTLYGAVTANWTASNLRVGSAGTLGFRVGGTSEFTSADLDTLLTNLATSDTVASNTAGHGMNAGATLLLDTSNATGGEFAYGGVIANTTGAQGGTRHLIKTGDNELTLSGANSYTGGTQVRGGTLHLDGGTNNSASFVVNAGADFIQSGTDWTTDLFHSTGAGSNIDVAQLADSSDNDSVIRYNLTPSAGISTIHLTAANPFANIGGGLGEWTNEWTIEFDLDAISSPADFQTLTLFSSGGGYNLANLAGLRMVTYDSEGNLLPAAPVQHGDTVYLAKSGNVVASFTAVFSANSVQLVFGSARAIPEPSTFGLIAMALALLRRRLRCATP